MAGRLAASQAAVLCGIGVVMGLVVGYVGSISLLAAERVPRTFLAWTTVSGTGVAVTLVAALVGYLTAPRRLSLSRRLG